MKPFKCDKPGCWKKNGFARPHTLRMHKGSCGIQRQHSDYEEAAERSYPQGPLHCPLDPRLAGEGAKVNC